MKKLFRAIRQDDNQLVKELIAKKPELIYCTAKQPPKKDDGQSPLQVALKTGNFEIAKYLLTKGADVNFIEAETCCNAWRAPVIHDAINAAIMCSRWNSNSKERADEAFSVLKEVIQLGADVNAKDSYGNSCINRACLQARQILPSDNPITNNNLYNDLSRIFKLLIGQGADLKYISPNSSGLVSEQYADEPLAEFLHE